MAPILLSVYANVNIAALRVLRGQRKRDIRTCPLYIKNRIPLINCLNAEIGGSFGTTESRQGHHALHKLRLIGAVYRSSTSTERGLLCIQSCVHVKQTK